MVNIRSIGYPWLLPLNLLLVLTSLHFLNHVRHVCTYQFVRPPHIVVHFVCIGPGRTTHYRHCAVGARQGWKCSRLRTNQLLVQVSIVFCRHSEYICRNVCERITQPHFIRREHAPHRHLFSCRTSVLTPPVVQRCSLKPV